MSVKKNEEKLMDKITNLAMKIAEPLAKIADKPAVAAIQDGLVAIMPMIIVGSLFLVMYVLGSPSVGSSGKALLPFLTPLAGKFIWVFQLTMSFMALYAAITISQSYAEKLDLDSKSAGLIGLSTFFVFVLGGLDEAGGIAITSFSASGLFVAIITSLVSIRIFNFCVKKKITIRMPEAVPPNIGNAFTALIPFAVSVTFAWIIRTLIGFDMVDWLTNVLTPVVSGADNVVTFAIKSFVTNLLWSVGLHGDNMFGNLFTPFASIWLEENAAAMASGMANIQLPHVWTLYGLERLQNWPTTVWPLIFLMIFSKVKYLRILGWACLPAGVFTIVEPVIFGLPVALNPFLIIPFLLSGLVTSILSYLAMSLGFVGRFYASLPWATPPFINGPLGTGDWKTILLVIGCFLIGLVIYLPFWKQFEASCLLKEEQIEREKLNG